MPTGTNTITGSATFTQVGAAVTLVIQVSNCPEGNHAVHLHELKDCGNNGLAAGDHWVPQGEVRSRVWPTVWAP
jgi:Cu-Zn family superoxide dismutase